MMGLLNKRIIFLIFLATSSVYIPAKMVNAENAGFFEQQKLTSYLLVNLFLEKVEQNGLTIFGEELSQADLNSHHVSYVHRTSDDTFQVQLCFTVSKHIRVPESDDFYVNKITVNMDKEGNILEILTHVSALDEGLDQEGMN